VPPDGALPEQSAGAAEVAWAALVLDVPIETVRELVLAPPPLPPKPKRLLEL